MWRILHHLTWRFLLHGIDSSIGSAIAARAARGIAVRAPEPTRHVSVREATTGKVLAKSTVEKQNARRSCNLVRSFDAETEGEFPVYQPELRALAEPLVSGS